MIVDVVAPGAVATTAADALHRAGLVILALPLARIHTVPSRALRGRTVVDAMNYWPPVDGVLGAFADTPRSSSEIVRDILDADRLVKTFNHLGYHDLESLARPGPRIDRKALAVAGDDPEAVIEVTRLVDGMGFDPVPAGTLADSKRLEQGSAVFGVALTTDQMRAALGRTPVPAP